MHVAEGVWARWGRVPATVVATALFVLAFAATLMLDRSVSAIVRPCLTVLLVSHCVARPANGWDLFWLIAGPNAIATTGHDVFGAPMWIGVVLIPFVIWGAWTIDRPSGATSSQTQDVHRARTRTPRSARR